MSELTTLRSYVELHIAVVLYGFTAILGDLIQISAVGLVWWRVLLASISLLFFFRLMPLIKRLDKIIMMKLIFIGFLIAIHWITFYGAIKYSNASITLICFATTSFFTSLIEPIYFKSKPKSLDIFVGLLIIPCMVLIVRTLDTSMLTGIYLGLFSAFLAAFFSTLNKEVVDVASPYEITFIELASAFLFISISLPFIGLTESQFWPSGLDFLYLIILALFCTTLAFALNLRALKKLSAFESNLVVNLEPVYGILLAILILNEHKELSPNFYWGVFLISCIVFGYPFVNKYLNKNKIVTS